MGVRQVALVDDFEAHTTNTNEKVQMHGFSGVMTCPLFKFFVEALVCVSTLVVYMTRSPPRVPPLIRAGLVTYSLTSKPLVPPLSSRTLRDSYLTCQETG